MAGDPIADVEPADAGEASDSSDSDDGPPMTRRFADGHLAPGEERRRSRCSEFGESPGTLLRQEALRAQQEERTSFEEQAPDKESQALLHDNESPGSLPGWCSIQ
eukprot:TRINITY_DN76912_c0_g1_i1.p2 TRINITY_DN76912_c0_g1~~TRINITY_DN76912_c0_g1_i1.p2  ORF type:complete len:114 (-),score=18.05 TRINITY_DN76912_c0_g1_i1:29-343(-)